MHLSNVALSLPHVPAAPLQKRNQQTQHGILVKVRSSNTVTYIGNGADLSEVAGLQGTEPDHW